MIWRDQKVANVLEITIVVHSRDNVGVTKAHEIKPPNNQPQFSQTTMGQYCLDKTKQAFRVEHTITAMVTGKLYF